MDYIRRRVLQIINEQNITQKELSERSNVPYISLNRFLSNRGNSVGIDTLLRIAEGLNMPIELLIAQKKINSSMLFDTIEFKINKLTPSVQKQFLISMNVLLDIMLSKEDIKS